MRLNFSEFTQPIRQYLVGKHLISRAACWCCCRSLDLMAGERAKMLKWCMKFRRGRSATACLEEAHKAFPGMFLKDRNFLSWLMWLEQLCYPAPIRLLKIGNFQSGFLIAKISSWHWTPFSFPSWFGLFSYSKKPKASQPARQPTSKSVHSKTSRGYIGISHQDEKFPPLWASSLGCEQCIQVGERRKNLQKITFASLMKAP